METSAKTKIVRDLENRQIKLTREFHAPVEKVWKAWTNSEILDQWWAPKPWKAKTKSMDFSEGGKWIYAMLGPNGEEHWARADYTEILPLKRFTDLDAFCDENGNVNNELPVMNWRCEFKSSAKGTIVHINISVSNKADLEKVVEMGFEEGISAAFENLDELLSA